MKDPSLILTIGNLNVRVKSGNRLFLNELRIYYPNFLGQAQSDIAAEVTVEHRILPFREDIAVTNEGGIYGIDGGEFKGEFSLKTRKGRFSMRAQAGLFDSFLRVFYSILLVHHGGFLVHAAGLQRNGRGYLFAGPSEAGKTTTAKHANGFAVLNDELVLVKNEENEFSLYATPFNGDYDGPIKNGSAALRGLCFLDKGLTEGIEAVSSMQALLRLMECVFFFDPDVRSNQKVLDLCHQLVSRFDGFKINILSREHLGEFIDEIEREHMYT